jgi:hypothetical protein
MPISKIPTILYFYILSCRYKICHYGHLNAAADLSIRLDIYSWKFRQREKGFHGQIESLCTITPSEKDSEHNI